MPVDDHPVHEKTKTGPDWRYGCNNHKPRKGNAYYAPDRLYRPDGTFYTVLTRIQTEWIEYESCPAYHNHQGCKECKHGSDKL